MANLPKVHVLIRGVYLYAKNNATACLSLITAFFTPTAKKRLQIKKTPVIKSDVAVLAQLVEQRIRNAWVGGSSPLNGTIFILNHPV